MDLVLRRQTSQGVAVKQNTTQGISLFCNEPPASPQDVAIAVAKLSSVFYRVKDEGFWTLLSQTLIKDSISKKRLDYIVDYHIHHSTYVSFISLAEILQTDRFVETRTQIEMAQQCGKDWSGWCLLQERDNQGRLQFARTEQAKSAGIAILREY